MSTNSCRNTQSLHYLDSWNRHCGGNWWEFSSRTLTIADSLFLVYAGAQAGRVGKLVGASFGSAMVSKSANDIYEAWTGRDGFARKAIGDPVYDISGYALIGYGLFNKVPKLGYLGNPKRDFFTRDPLSYEFAFKQYSRLEIFHLTSSEIINGYSNLEKYHGDIRIEDAWIKHIARCRANAD